MAKEKVAKKATRIVVQRKLLKLLLLPKYLQLKNRKLNQQNNSTIILIDIKKAALKRVAFFVDFTKDTLKTFEGEQSD